jgi:archaemetzincin
MRYQLPALSIIFFIVSCHTGTADQQAIPAVTKTIIKKEKHSIAILPFNGIDSTTIKEMRDGIQKQLDVELTVLANRTIPDFAFYQPRQRYIADSLLVFLQQVNKNKVEKIIGVTAKDISTRKGTIENWGILGLGSCPGEACVVSSFRAGKNKVTYPVFLCRMTTLALHELGHTYGLEHCPVADCLMKDAGGKMNLDDGNSFCSQCRKYLLDKGISK